jgi:hypothetical protein
MKTEEPAPGQDLFLTSTGQRPPLRIGVLLDGWELPRWQRTVLDQIRASDFAEITLLLVHDARDRPDRADRSWRTLLFRVYARVDRRFYGTRRTPPPDEVVDCRDLSAPLPHTDLVVHGSGDAMLRRPQEPDRLRQQELDVLIDFGVGGLDPSILDAPRHGVWRCHYGPDAGAGQAGLKEMADQATLVSVTLRRITRDPGADQVLARGTTSTVAGISWTLNRFEPIWIGTELIQQTLHRLHQHGPGGLETRAVEDCPTTRFGLPTNGETLRFLAAGLARKALRRVSPPYGDVAKEWRLAIRRLPDAAADLPFLADASGFHWIESPPGRHWADPFVLEQDGRHWLFFEEYLHDEARGVISVAPLNDQGRPGPARRILDTGGHLSYPFTFEDAGEVYLLPEAAGQAATTLYRAVDFPHRWEKVAVLGDGLQLLDTTVLRHDGLYWFFTTVPGRHRSGYTALLFYAESLTGAWHPHPASPISRDIRHARGAGRIVRAGGGLFRPVQDGAGGYGRKIHFFEIMELTVDTFQQEPRGTVGPANLPDAPRRLEGIHTYNRTTRFEVIDGVRLERRSR